AVSMKKGYGSSNVKTSTYLFLDRIKSQGYPGGAWPPSAVNGQVMDYNMDSRVVNDNRYKNLIDDALLDIPTLSISTDLENLFDPDSGIYVNAQFHGEKWERPCSVELIHPDGADGFQIDAGLRIRGGWSRHGDCPKHAFRLFFRGRYGKGKLDYPLFGKEGAGEFDKMDLRTAMNYSWSYYGDPLNIMNRDVFSRDAQGEMGQPYTRSRYYHLVLDGMYWGLYQTQERSEARFAETYFGGSHEDYDVVKTDIGDWWNLYVVEATDGNLDAWKDVWNLCRQGFSSNNNFFRIQGLGSDGKRNPSLPVLVDINNLIDYMLIIFLTGNFDAPVTKFGQNKGPNNFYAIYNRNGLSGFKFFAQDNEHTLLTDERSPGVGIQENRVNISGLSDGYRMTVDDFSKFHPQWLHFRLTSNPEYRMRFADRAYRHLFNKGALTPEANSRRFSGRADEIRLAIIAESARWGDSRSGSPRTRDDDWAPQIRNVVENYFPYRNDIVISQMIDEGLFTPLKTVKISSGGSEILDASMGVQSGYQVTLVNLNPAGSIRYTTDGTDPRAVEGAVSHTALDGANQAEVTVTRTTLLKARIRNGSAWSPLHEILFTVAGESDALKITEIHYHPLDQDTLNDGLFEFLEIKNTGSASIDLSRMSFVNGITYTFPEGSVLPPDAFWVLASDPDRFRLRYGFNATGMYAGRLDNSGERLTLLDAAQDTVMTFRYGDESPWPPEADGAGYSLVPANPDLPGDPANPLLWRRSWETHGSPGRDDIKTGPESGVVPLPVETRLYDGYPNPFNAAATFLFDLESPGPVTVRIFDMRGREIAQLAGGFYSAGRHALRWDAGGNTAGIYVCRMQAGKWAQNRKILLLK
ncbi:CotH kinase family protein, partial [bacterium]|nr:CotH kinase family protein [bacterium]